MPLPSRQLVAAFALGLWGCLNNSPPPAAPTDLQQNVKWFWTNSDAAQDTDLLSAAGKLSTAAGASAWTMAVEGQSTAHLANADVIAFVTDQSTDPDPARPLLVINEFNCTQAQLEKVLTTDDQNSLFPKTYDKYVRTDDYNRDDFLAKKIDLATWSNEVDLTFSFVNDSYTSTVKGSLRRIPKADSTFAQSDVLIARTWLPAPATFLPGATSYYKQDYEIEIFWEQSPGRMFHAYGMWRQIKIGGSINLTLDDNSFMNLVLNNLVNWDTSVEKLCATM
jgi:hypothetical protein